MARLFPNSNFVPAHLVAGSRLCVGEAPGELEAERSEPFVGTSGGWLFGKEGENGKRSGGLYRAAGVEGATVSKCNVLGCRPPGNIFPTDPDARDYISKEEAEAALKQCWNNHVKPVLTGRNWTRIDCFGDKSLIALTGKTGIMRWRGSPLAVPACGPEPLTVPTLHPAYIARDQSYIPAVVKDLSKTLDLAPEHYNTTPTLEDVRAFQFREFATDIETVRTTGEITMVGLCGQKYTGLSVPPKGVYLTELKRIFANATDIVTWNGEQFDLPRLKAIGIEPPKDFHSWDGMLMEHLCFPDMPHGLGFVGSFLLNKTAWKHLSGDDETLYNIRDCDATFQIYQQLRPMLRNEGLLDLYQNVQVPLARICHLLHETGFRIDPARLKTVRADLEHKSKELENELPAELQTQEVPIRKRVLAPPGTLSERTKKPLKYVMTDSTESVTPWKSSEVLKDYLYAKAKLPVQTHAKTNEPTVDKVALPKLIRAASRKAYEQEVGLDKALEVLKALRVLQQLRQIASLLSTFVKESWEDSGVERIHASFNVHGTASGRLSSSGPNLQNLPASARYIYVPSHNDWVIVSSDFASLENRLTALLSNDYERLDRLAQPGYSEHKYNASTLFDIPYDEVVKDSAGDSPYTKAKKVTHGLNYAEGAMKIAKINDLPYAEVKVLVDKWKAANPKTIAWQNETAARAKADGYLTNPFGRKRFFYTSSAHTESISFLPQSCGAEILIRCMIALMYDRIGWPESEVQKVVQVYHPLPHPARLLVTVHDSFVLETPLNMVDEVKTVLEKVLTQPWKEFGGYSFPVETGVGGSWGEAK
jgi:uracil-DNA glycosylase family 4